MPRHWPSAVTVVRLTTTDPAAHVAEALGSPLPNLQVSRIDPEAETRAYVDEAMRTAGASLDAAGRALLEEDLRSPCTEEVAVFRAFARVVDEAERGFVVIDTAPTGHTLLLLDAAEAYHREVLRTAGNAPEEVRRLLPRLRDPAFTRILLVTLPEATPVHEAAALQRDLERAEIRPFAWVIDQSLSPLPVSDPVLRQRRAQEARYLREVTRPGDTHGPRALEPRRRSEGRAPRGAPGFYRGLAMTTPTLPKRAVAEFVGTAFLLATVVGSGIMGERLAGGNVAIALLANTVATGAGLVALILTFGPVSGAHFNPAVTLADASQGGLAWRDVPVVLRRPRLPGAFAGVAVAHFMFKEPALFFASQHERSGASQLVSEFVATFGLLAVIWGCVRRRPDVVPFAVGAYITAAYWFTSSTSFANPAVTLARAASDTFAGIRPRRRSRVHRRAAARGGRFDGRSSGGSSRRFPNTPRASWSASPTPRKAKSPRERPRLRGSHAGSCLDHRRE